MFAKIAQYLAAYVAGTGTPLEDGASSGPLIDSQRRLVVVGAGTGGTTTIVRQARVARAVHLASATLPVSGNYSNQTAYAIPDGVAAVMFYVTYTRGAASGQPKFKIAFGNGTEEGIAAVVDATITISQPFSQQPVRGGEFPGPVPADGTAIVFTILVKIDGGPTTVRLLAAEVGVTGTPGVLAIALTAGY